MKTALLIALLTIAQFLHGSIDNNRILFLLHRGELNDAIELYQASIRDHQHDHDVIEQICLLILEKGFRDPDPEIQLVTLFGAGIAANEKAHFIIEEAMRSPRPQIQLAAMNILVRSQHDGIDEELKYALRSPFLIIRLEALLHLAELKNPKTASYTESLMAIVDDELLPIFPEIFVTAGDGTSTKILKKLISHPQENVRVSTILSLAKHQRDDFLPKIRILATHHSPKQLEACAYAFGVLKDESAIPRLTQLATSNHDNVKLAALTALYRLGRKDSQKEIEKMALKEDLFAIAALEEMVGAENTLACLLQSSNPHVRINAAMGLLKNQDTRCLAGLADILLKDQRDLGFTKSFSMGRTVFAWKVIPSAQQNFEELPLMTEQSLQLKQQALIGTLELDEKTFLQVAEGILSNQHNELVPALVPLLENKQTPQAIALLKRFHQKAGAPLIRQCCNLALYSLKEEGPYESLIKEWILAHRYESLFRFRPAADLNTRDPGNSFELTTDETSNLLIASIEALAKAQNNTSIDILLDLIKQGNPKNRYALAGLLMRVAL